MKICVVSDVLGTENNGTTIAAMNLIRSLRKRGHEVRILSPDAEHKGEKDYYIVPTLNFGIFNEYVKKNGVVLAKKDKNVINEALDGIDACHIMLPFSLCQATLKECLKRNIPITAGFHTQAENVTAHFGLMFSHFASWAIYNYFYRHVYKKVGAIHYPSEFIRDTFEKTINKKTNGKVISNGVNSIFVKKEVERPDYLKDKIGILFIGRLSREKKHKYLIKAVKMSKYEKDIQLVFAGVGPTEKGLRRLSSSLTNKPYINFFNHEDLVNTINSCDLYVHPSSIEIEAISCLEAITCGLVPVINDSPKSATRYFAVDDKNLFKKDSPKDLAQKIDYWIEHPKEKSERSKDYLGYTKKFAFESCMDQMEKMIIENYKKHKSIN
ncbi:MAG: glycosyltransferase [Bacillales bacterium]|nr:glycosyltransferase [Bacillales bacterium]